MRQDSFVYLWGTRPPGCIHARDLPDGCGKNQYSLDIRAGWWGKQDQGVVGPIDMAIGGVPSCILETSSASTITSSVGMTATCPALWGSIWRPPARTLVGWPSTGTVASVPHVSTWAIADQVSPSCSKHLYSIIRILHVSKAAQLVSLRRTIKQKSVYKNEPRQTCLSIKCNRVICRVCFSVAISLYRLAAIRSDMAAGNDHCHVADLKEAAVFVSLYTV